MRWCLVRYWRRRRARDLRQRHDLVVIVVGLPAMVACSSALNSDGGAGSLGSTGSWWFVVAASRPCSGSTPWV